MQEHISALESAISDVGYWQWWTEHLPETFQVEFGGVQLWNPPSGEGKPPSGQIAIRFRKPRLVCFLTMSDSVPSDWPEQLRRDELEPFNIRHDAFTLSSGELCGKLLSKAVRVRAIVGEHGVSPRPIAEEACIGIDAHSVGLVVAAESMQVLNMQGELDAQAVLSSHKKWWEYWKEYWKRKDAGRPLPRDYACEVTIPAGNS